MRSILFWIALVLWLILGYFYYNSSNECCADVTHETSKITETVTKTVAPVKAAIKNATGPLMFNWADGKTITGEKWDARLKQLLAGLKDNQRLEITGLYRSDETNNTKFENLGLARANETAKLFMPPLSKDRIQLVGKLTSGEVDRTNPFESATFRNLINTANIKEVGDKTIIRFPFNSTNKLNDREVENYLTDVAKRVKRSGERVRLTGHTDSIGSNGSNISLGQRRANIIKSYLVKRGVSPSKIITNSKGEANPIANNSSNTGRAENRRTELQIIK